MEASLLRERLLEAPTPRGKFQVFESCLLKQAFVPLERHCAVECALALFRNIHTAPAMAKVSDHIGISSRRLIQLFSHQVGLTPKLFCRQGGEFDWVDLAADGGYFDQAHFIHDFNAFSGMNPTTYLARKTEHLNHVPIPD